MKVYVDTCVYVDLLEREDRRSSQAYEFFEIGWNCKYELVVSDWIVAELKRRNLDSDFPLIFQQFKNKNKLHVVKHSEVELAEAKAKSDHWQDYLHYMIAKRERCDKIITRDNGFISSFSQVFDITYPENI
jgi:predicted nucleic acid-binding protein